MKILVIGASKGTGALTVKAALARDHDVTAFSRSAIELEHGRLTKRQGDFHDHASVAGAVPGHDAVVITAMTANGVKRLIVLSALGVGESRVLAGFILARILIAHVLKGPYQDHER